MEENNPTVETSTPNKKGGKLFGIIAIVAVIVLIIGGLLLAKSLLNSPKNVFKKAIEEGYKNVETGFEELEKIQDILDFQEHAIEVEGNIKGSTDVDEILEDLDVDELELSFSGKIGLDYKNELVQVEGKIKGTKEELDAAAFLQENGAYLKTSLYDKVIKLADDITDEFDFAKVKKELESEIGDIEIDVKKYEELTRTVKDALINALDEKSMSKESTKYKVLGKEVKGTKYTYTLDSKSARKLTEKMINYLLKDKKFVKNLAEITGEDEEDIKEELEEMKDDAENIELDEKIKVNLYTRGLKNTLSGIEISEGKYFKAGYYTDGKNYELIFDDGAEKVTLTAEKEGKEYNLVAKVDKEKVLSGTIREFTKDKIDMDLDIEGAKFKVYLTDKIEKNKMTGEFSLKITYEGESVALEGDYLIESKDKLEKINTSDAVTSSEVDVEKLEKNIEEKIEKDKSLNAIYEAGKKEIDYYKDDWGDDWDDDDWGDDWDNEDFN